MFSVFQILLPLQASFSLFPLLLIFFPPSTYSNHSVLPSASLIGNHFPCRYNIYSFPDAVQTAAAVCPPPSRPWSECPGRNGRLPSSPRPSAGSLRTCFCLLFLRVRLLSWIIRVRCCPQSFAVSAVAIRFEPGLRAECK